MQFQCVAVIFFYFVFGISDDMCLFMTCLLFMKNYTTELCTLMKRSNTMLKIKRFWDNCLGNGNIYIWAERMIHSTFYCVLVCLHTCLSLVLLQRAPVSQRSKQTAEHSHFTLLNLSPMAFTPVAALSSETQNKIMHCCLKVQIRSFICSMGQAKVKIGLWAMLRQV